MSLTSSFSAEPPLTSRPVTAGRASGEMRGQTEPSLRIVGSGPSPSGPSSSETAEPTRRVQEPDRAEISDEARSATAPTGRDGEPLDDAEQRQVEELKARDQEVRTHEQAHVAAAGPLYRGGPNYTYRTGPDGNRYAVGGNVQIDTSEGATPEETITKAQQIRRAALAPQEPSSTDRSVAAKASRMEAQARAELARSETSDEDMTSNEQDADRGDAISGYLSVEQGGSGDTGGSQLGRRLDVAA
ncbi:MAG: putative metalloprotease CJM1_0395 family protein [Planctomycetota bacterium]